MGVDQPQITLADVSFSFAPDRPVLRRCCLELRPGQRVGVTGANGSGKSTLLHLIVGLLMPDEGTIEAFGKPRNREADFREVRRRAGLLFQDSEDQLFCPTVAEDVAFGPLNLGRTRGQVHEVVARSLDTLGLAGYEDRVTYQLSGGEKRLVALATVLAMEPDVLLLDEPTAGLDEAVQQRLADLLVGLPQAMLIASHDRAFLQQIATRTEHLRDGHL
ncbi:MAG: ABC transporter ATP-binding protein [Planctomycetes bacterium]|nr:ABC transporter ATP-binding protein [Planctomycetota bacterium]